MEQRKSYSWMKETLIGKKGQRRQKHRQTTMQIQASYCIGHVQYSQEMTAEKARRGLAVYR